MSSIKPPVAELSTFQKNLLAENGDTAAWVNADFKSPASFCLMPLPDAGASAGFILKNFTYNETIHFSGSNANAKPVNAPNRGGHFLQNSTVLFYDQRVTFAEGPSGPKEVNGETVRTIVHEENGAWLSLAVQGQLSGPYFEGPPIGGDIPTQPERMNTCKQMSVPHGNSILALGSSTQAIDYAKTPFTIPDFSAPFPTPLNGAPELPTTPYTTRTDSDTYPPGYQNPDPATTANVNSAIQKSLAALAPNIDQYIFAGVSTEVDSGIVTNIPFEDSLGRVTNYSAQYWLIKLKGEHTFNHLLYTQSIPMTMVVKEHYYSFPHITCNTLTRLGA